MDFLAEVEAVFDRIGRMPNMHGMVYEDIRRAVVKRYPYSVYYRPEPSRVVVLSVFHGKRDPRIWQSRV